MLLTDVETMVRQDLFDPLGSATQRWQTSDIDRAIDKAVDRYSQYYPNIVFTDMATQPYQRTYPYPQPWNSQLPRLVDRAYSLPAAILWQRLNPPPGRHERQRRRRHWPGRRRTISMPSPCCHRGARQRRRRSSL